MKTHWNNPWKGKCIELDSGSIRICTSEPHYTVKYDLYAIVTDDKLKTIHFGAKFSDEPSDYESGDASYYDGKWHITTGRYTGKAAAEYFANHHHG